MPVRTHGLSHIALKVHDAHASFRFYEQIFGLVVVYQGEGFVQAQTPGTWDVLVFEEAAERVGPGGGVVHFGFRLTDPGDIEAAIAAVESAGGTVTSHGEFCPGEPYLFATDPDGYEFEIWYELPTTADPGTGL